LLHEREEEEAKCSKKEYGNVGRLMNEWTGGWGLFREIGSWKKERVYDR